jgi:hypothetical protein
MKRVCRFSTSLQPYAIISTEVHRRLQRTYADSKRRDEPPASVIDTGEAMTRRPELTGRPPLRTSGGPGGMQQ